MRTILYLLYFGCLLPNIWSIKPSWLQTEPSDEQLNCTCQIKENVKCFVGAKKKGKLDCHEVYRSIQGLVITCDDFNFHTKIVPEEILRHYPNLKSLTINNCCINATIYRFDKDNSTFRTNVSMISSPFTKNRYHLKFTAEPILKISPNLPKCKLTALKMNKTLMTDLPAGLINSCPNLYYLDLSNNNLNIITNLDFVVLMSLSKLRYLLLHSNYIRTLSEQGDRIVGHLLKRTKEFMTEKLPQWLMKNKALLQNETMESFQQLLFEFKQASNQLSTRDFIHIMEKTQAPLDLNFNDHLTKMNLSGNRLDEIPFELLWVRKLNKLDLSNNRIRSHMSRPLKYGFYALRNTVKDLSLRGNRITDIKTDNFIYLKALKVLDLSHNLIQSFSKHSIISGMDLKTLKLDHNLIRELNFAHKMKQLKRLSVSYNHIKSIGSGLTSHIPSIEELDFSYNPFMILAKGAIQNLTELKWFNLSYAYIRDMPATSFLIEPTPGGDRPVVYIYNNFQTLNCGCLSVFAAIKSQISQNDKFTFPWVKWSPGKQKCRHGDVPLKLSLAFRCYFSNQYCSKQHKCSCCHDQSTFCRCRWECPKDCICHFDYPEKNRVIDCKNRSLSYIPETNIYNVQSFYLTNNNILGLQPGSFQSSLKTLKSLYLDRNGITFIGIHIFDEVVELNVLSLSHNKISWINENAFAPLKKLEILNLDYNKLKVYDQSFFSHLPKLYKIYLYKNPFVCDCNISKFLKFRRKIGLARNLFIGMSGSCIVTATLRNYAGIKNKTLPVSSIKFLCKEVERTRAIIISVSISVSIVFLVLVIFLASRHKYKVRVYLDNYIRSALARTILRLPTHNARAGIDVGFLIHERQTEHFYAIRRRLVGTPRESLHIIRLADHMPGSTRLGQIAHLADSIACCVVILSSDFLNDSLFLEALRILLIYNVEHNDCQMTLLPILLDQGVNESPEWSQLEVMLRSYPSLKWNQSFFWERLLTSLPPPPPNDGDDPDEEDRTPLDRTQENVHREGMSHLCVIAHENQSAVHVRELFDHYREVLNVCHVRHRNIYGRIGDLQARESLGLNQVLGNSLQVVVVVSLEFLRDAWTHEVIIPGLKSRLLALPFRGTIILLEIGGSFAHLCQDANFSFYDELRHNNLVVTLAWQDVENNWAVLNRHLLPESITGDRLRSQTIAMDEDEFVRILMTPAANLIESRGPEYNIFEQNQQRWPRAVHENQDVSENV